MKYFVRMLFILSLVLVGAAAGFAEMAPDIIPLTNLKAGVQTVDITSPLELELEGYADRTGSATGIHTPLEAVVTVFDDGRTKAALISFDTLMMDQTSGTMIKERIQEKAGIPPEHVILNVSHTHGSPRIRSDADYQEQVTDDVADAAVEALKSSRPVSIGYGEGVIDFNINRRVIGADGKCRSGLNPDGICDHRVKVLRIDDDSDVSPMAVIMHAVCHANVFRGANTKISADFPGVAKDFVEQNFGGQTAASFLQGCCGDARANLPSVPGGWKASTDDFGRSGNELEMTWAGGTLGAEAYKVAARLRVKEYVMQRPDSFRIAGVQRTIHVDADPEKVKNGFWDRAWDKIENGKIPVNLKVLRIGDIWFVGIPGEPVVEYALQIEEKMNGLGKVFVLGYTTGDSGYIPVAHMFAEGGYETQGPYCAASEPQIIDAVMAMVDEIK